MLVKKYERKKKIKITFLGTSHGVPSEKRYCTAVLLEVGDSAYLIDAGAPVTDILLRKGFDITKIKAIFNTHFHMDHIAGGLHFINLCSWFFVDTDFDVYLPSDKGRKAIEILFDAEGSKPSERIRLKNYSDDFVYDDGNIRLVPIRNAHVGDGFDSFGFCVEIGDRRILFTGDLSNDLAADDFPKAAFDGHFDVIVSECAHFGADKLTEEIRKTDTDIFAVTHVYPFDKFAQLDKLSDSFDCTLLLAEDDDEIEF